MYDLVIKKAKIQKKDTLLDIGIKNGTIVDLAADLNTASKEYIYADGKIVIPGFVDSHMHLEKALVGGDLEVGGLLDAVNLCRGFFKSFTKEDIKSRAREIVYMSVKNGTTALRTHTYVNDSFGTLAIEALHELKGEVADLIDIQIVAMPQLVNEALTTEELATLDKIKDLIDLYGGAPHILANPFKTIDQLFSLAVKNNITLDFHVDETDEPSIATLEYIARKTIELKMQGKVTVGHLCGLAAVGEEEAQKAIQLAKEAELHVVTLPSCNLYLMGRNDKQPIRRGVTRVKELLEAGINVSYASDNIRDAFKPFGNANMLEEALLTAQVTQMGTPKKLEKVFEMGTYNPARALGLKNYGVEVGCQADLVILAAKSIPEAIISQANKEYVLKKGKIIVENRIERITRFNLNNLA